MMRVDSQENGTCATIWPLWHAEIKNMQVADLTKSFHNAPPLSIDDILHSPIETAFFNKCLVHSICRMIVTHGGDSFKKFRKDLESNQPRTDQLIEVHKTSLHPLPAWNIDESTIVGNAEVAEVIFDELGVLEKKHTLYPAIRIFTTDHRDTCKFFLGDQLSIARLRALVSIRAGQEGGFSGFGWGVWMPGLFHGKICDIHGMFVTHWGKPNAGTRNPGCLAFHNTRLHRAPIVLTSLPTFRVCRDLVFTSLYARILHCLLLVSGTESLEEYTASVDSWDTLQGHAQAIFKQYANTHMVSDLRSKRHRAERTSTNTTGTLPTEGDMIFENAVLFLRDALISREFTDSIKCGDSGRIVLVLKIWALSFRGSGRTKYAHEMLHLIHNIEHVWPKPIR